MVLYSCVHPFTRRLRFVGYENLPQLVQIKCAFLHPILSCNSGLSSISFHLKHRAASFTFITDCFRHVFFYSLLITCSLVRRKNFSSRVSEQVCAVGSLSSGFGSGQTQT